MSRSVSSVASLWLSTADAVHFHIRDVGECSYGVYDSEPEGVRSNLAASPSWRLAGQNAGRVVGENRGGDGPSPVSRVVNRRKTGCLLASEETAQQSGTHLDDVVHGFAVTVAIKKAGEHIDRRGRRLSGDLFLPAESLRQPGGI